MAQNDDQVEIKIDTILQNMGKRIAALSIELAMAEARSDALSELIASLRSENDLLADRLNEKTVEVLSSQN